MDIFIIVFASFVAVIFVLALGGVAASRKRLQRHAADLDRQIESANEKLALAHAGDKGWNPEVIQRKAREGLQKAQPEVEIEKMSLIHVVDKVGTDNDQAVFHVFTQAAEYRVTLGRQDGQWVYIEQQAMEKKPE